MEVYKSKMNKSKFLISLVLMNLTILVSCVESNSKKIVEEPKEEYRNYNMVYVEGGEFVMGKVSKEDALPHKIYLNDFYISDIEVTQKFYEQVMGQNPSYERYLGANKPVNNVSWYDAIVFCNRLSEQEGLEPCYLVDGLDIICDFNAKGYRLPTEAEWEYAARGGKYSHDYDYSGSDRIYEVGWYWSDEELKDIALKQVNELNIFDMTGNVSEWCWDFYDENYYRLSKYKNPLGPENILKLSNGNVKVYRGGSYIKSYEDCTVYVRDYLDPSNKLDSLGFRICRSKINESNK